MELRSGKRLRKEISNEFGLSSEKSRSKCAIVTIPKLVSHIFLINLKDIGLLKTCRLVCKSWNFDATVSLRACSKVTLTEVNPKIMKFGDVLRGRASRLDKQLPSPFRNIHANGSAYTDPAFLNLLLRPELTITGLHLDLHRHNRKFDNPKFGRVLAANKQTITSLNIHGLGGLSEPLSANYKFKFPALKHLQFDDYCQYCACVPIVKNILSMSVPESVTFIFHDGDILISLLSQEKVDHLKHLTLDIASISSQTWRHLCKLRFVKLRTLIFRYCRKTDDEPDHVEQWDLFCKNVSPLLENFDFETDNNFALSTDPELSFPNLQIIKLWDQNALYEFQPHRFPSLSKVICCVSSHLLVNQNNDVVPHHGVQCVQICVKRSLELPDDVMCLLLTYLSRQFPNVSSLIFDAPGFCKSAITIIYEAFPKITALSLNGSCDFSLLWGARRPDLITPLENIPDRKSIMDFSELEKISLGRNFHMKPYMISLCFKRVPQLKHLEFRWNKSLPAFLRRDAVGNLESVVMDDSTKDEWGACMVRVSKMVPNDVKG